MIYFHYNCVQFYMYFKLEILKINVVKINNYYHRQINNIMYNNNKINNLFKISGFYW